MNFSSIASFCKKVTISIGKFGFNCGALRKELRSIGANFITAGMVGIFINHYTGLKWSTVLYNFECVFTVGGIFLLLGLIQRKKL